MTLSTTSKAKFPPRIIIKSTKGVFAIKEIFTEKLKSRFIEKLIVDNSKTMYLYFDSPGASVFALQSMIEQMKVSDKRFVCIARSASSAAFILFQYCDVRYMLPYGSILMSHNASLSLDGEINNVQSAIDMWKGSIEKIEREVATRLKMSYLQYKKFIASGVFLNYKKARKYHAVDGSIYLTCTRSAVKTRIKTTKRVCTLFGGCKTKTEFVSACPLIDKKF